MLELGQSGFNPYPCKVKGQKVHTGTFAKEGEGRDHLLVGVPKRSGQARPQLSSKGRVLNEVRHGRKKLWGEG